MIRSYSNRFEKQMCILFPGDYFATREDCILATVVGACVCICLYDENRRIGGMGHFIVPGMIGTDGIIVDEIAKHGITSMEYLMGEIVKLGGDRKDLKTKLFGAGYIRTGALPMEKIVQSNIRFMKEYFELEKIQVVKEDLGGAFRRKIYFTPTSGVIYRKPQRRNEDSSEFKKLEQEYIDSIFRKKPRYGKVYLFE